MSKNFGNEFIDIYADGGAHNGEDDPMHGIGAWAWVAKTNDDIAIVHCGRVNDTTNNRTEMMAVMEAIKSNPGCQMNIISDSSYVVKGYNHPAYLDAWKNNGWKTAAHKDVKNRDLWEQLLSLTFHNAVKFTLIHGHYKDQNEEHAFWNAIVDNACTDLMRSGISVNETTMMFDIKKKRFIV